MKYLIIAIAIGQLALYFLVGIIALPVYVFSDLSLTSEAVLKYFSLLPLSMVIFTSGVIQD